MTPNGRADRIDQQIEEALRRRAGTGHAPADLVPAIVRATASTPQRRGAGARSGASWMSSRGLLVAAALLVAGAVTAGVVGSLRPVRDDRSALPDVAVTATAMPTATPRSTQAAPTAVPSSDNAGQPVDFTAVRGLSATLVSDTVGWITTSDDLYRSTDDGRTWRATNAPGFPDPTGVAIVDVQTAFVAGGAEGGSMTIAATHDGGATWTTSSIAVGEVGSPPILQSSSPSAGTATVFDNVDVAPARLRVWTTSDGGATWAGPDASDLPGHQAKLGGWGRGAMWLNVGKADGVPFDDRLWISFDGGRTWPARTFPTTGFARAGELKWLSGSPIRDDAGRLVIMISNGEREGVFASDDDGTTWRLLLTLPADPPSDRSISALSDTTWVLTNGQGSDAVSTIDGGETWRRVVGGGAIWSLDQSFATVDHAWAVHSCQHNPILPDHGPDSFCDGTGFRHVLLETLDGGKSWHVLGR